MPITEGMVVSGIMLIKFILDKVWRERTTLNQSENIVHNEEIKLDVVNYLKIHGICVSRFDVLIEDLTAFLNDYKCFNLDFIKLVFDSVWEAENTGSLNSGEERYSFVNQVISKYLQDNNLHINNLDILIKRVVDLFNNHNFFWHL